jgi:hypothetical protein
VLGDDSALAAGVPAAQRDAAARASWASLVHVDRGVWEPPGLGSSGHGLLVLNGFLVRAVTFRNRRSAEVLGPGDLLRPDEDDRGPLGGEASWRVLAGLRLALLDDGWSRRMAPFPDVAVALTGRAMLRARRLAATVAIMQCRQLDERLHLVLWELADRFGRVGVDGVRLDIPMTHDVLSHVAGAQRPSVSSALSRLSRAGLVQRTRRGWLLPGNPPAEIRRDQAVSVRA